MTASNPSLPSFEQMAALEPGLRALRDEAASQALKDAYLADPEFCANMVWARQLKPKLSNLVGWFRFPRHAVLSTPAAFDVAFDAIYGALPACREGCGCMHVSWQGDKPALAG